jgi:hypothetical protein
MQIRNSPARRWESPAIEIAGRLLAEILKHGAFARVQHAPLRALINHCAGKGWYNGVFVSAVNWLRRNEPYSASVDWRKVLTANDACLLLADRIESEADAMKEAEDMEVHQRKTSEELAKPAIDKKAQRVRVKGKWVDVTPAGMNMLTILFAAKGKWVAGKTIGDHASTTRKRLPLSVRNLVQTDKAQGFRIAALLPK